jgi:hypothetical protein
VLAHNKIKTILAGDFFMKQIDESTGESRVGVPTYMVEAAVAAVLMVLGLLVAFGSVKIGARWAADGPGAGYFPFYLGLILIISSAGILYQCLRNKKKNAQPFVDTTQFKRVMAVLIPALFYVLGIELVGIYLASAVYIALFMIFLGKYAWIKGIAAGLAVNIVLFLMFEVWFKVPLYKGALDPLRFLGY